MSRAAVSSSRLLKNASKTVFFSCDIQERFRPLIFQMPRVVTSALTLCDTAKILGHPVVITEQYPKAFGPTVPELDGHADGARFEKKMFSMLTQDVREHLDGLGFFGEGEASHAVLYGIEAHVCVQQTALELLESGVQVHVVEDAVSSQRQADRDTALRMMADAGALVTSTESAMLGMVGGADHPRFKEVSKRLIEHNKTVE